MSTSMRRRLGHILIITGLLILLVLGIYEASSYPWRMLFSQWGWTQQETVETLPEPSPLPDTIIREPEEPTASPLPEDEGAIEDADLALEQPQRVFTRPEVELTVLGTIKIPKISLSEHLVSGTGNEMYYGVGHEVHSALPGRTGNCVLAAHRNLIVAHHFRHLDKLAEGDEIYLTYEDQTYCYVVYQTLVVEPTETWVMAPQNGETAMITLITCTPALNPTHRLIVWGRLVGEPADAVPAEEAPEVTPEETPEPTPPEDVPEVTPEAPPEEAPETTPPEQDQLPKETPVETTPPEPELPLAEPSDEPQA